MEKLNKLKIIFFLLLITSIKNASPGIKDIFHTISKAAVILGISETAREYTLYSYEEAIEFFKIIKNNLIKRNIGKNDPATKKAIQLCESLIIPAIYLDINLRFLHKKLTLLNNYFRCKIGCEWKNIKLIQSGYQINHNCDLYCNYYKKQI